MIELINKTLIDISASLISKELHQMASACVDAHVRADLIRNASCVLAQQRGA